MTSDFEDERGSEAISAATEVGIIEDEEAEGAAAEALLELAEAEDETVLVGESEERSSDRTSKFCSEEFACDVFSAIVNSYSRGTAGVPASSWVTNG